MNIQHNIEKRENQSFAIKNNTNSSFDISNIKNDLSFQKISTKKKVTNPLIIPFDSNSINEPQKNQNFKGEIILNASNSNNPNLIYDNQQSNSNLFNFDDSKINNENKIILTNQNKNFETPNTIQEHEQLNFINQMNDIFGQPSQNINNYNGVETDNNKSVISIYSKDIDYSRINNNNITNIIDEKIDTENYFTNLNHSTTKFPKKVTQKPIVLESNNNFINNEVKNQTEINYENELNENDIVLLDDSQNKNRLEINLLESKKENYVSGAYGGKIYYPSNNSFSNLHESEILFEDARSYIETPKYPPNGAYGNYVIDNSLMDSKAINITNRQDQNEINKINKYENINGNFVAVEKNNLNKSRTSRNPYAETQNFPALLYKNKVLGKSGIDLDLNNQNKSLLLLNENYKLDNNGSFFSPGKGQKNYDEIFNDQRRNLNELVLFELNYEENFQEKKFNNSEIIGNTKKEMLSIGNIDKRNTTKPLILNHNFQPFNDFDDNSNNQNDFKNLVETEHSKSIIETRAQDRFQPIIQDNSKINFTTLENDLLNNTKKLITSNEFLNNKKFENPKLINNTINYDDKTRTFFEENSTTNANNLTNIKIKKQSTPLILNNSNLNVEKSQTIIQPINPKYDILEDNGNNFSNNSFMDEENINIINNTNNNDMNNTNQLDPKNNYVDNNFSEEKNSPINVNFEINKSAIPYEIEKEVYPIPIKLDKTVEIKEKLNKTFNEIYNNPLLNLEPNKSIKIENNLVIIEEKKEVEIIIDIKNDPYKIEVEIPSKEEPEIIEDEIVFKTKNNLNDSLLENSLIEEEKSNYLHIVINNPDNSQRLTCLGQSEKLSLCDLNNNIFINNCYDKSSTILKKIHTAIKENKYFSSYLLNEKNLIDSINGKIPQDYIKSLDKYQEAVFKFLQEKSESENILHSLNFIEINNLENETHKKLTLENKKTLLELLLGKSTKTTFNKISYLYNCEVLNKKYKIPNDKMISESVKTERDSIYFSPSIIPSQNNNQLHTINEVNESIHTNNLEAVNVKSINIKNSKLLSYDYSDPIEDGRIFCWRDSLCDGNSFYRNFMFSYLENLILNKDVKLLAKIFKDIICIYEEQKKKETLIFSDININSVIMIINFILNYMKLNDFFNAYKVLVNAINLEDSSFDKVKK